jgi:hypothetical protein
MVHCFLIAKAAYPRIDFAFGAKSRKRPGVFLKRIFRWAGRTDDCPVTFHYKLHSIAFPEAQAATDLKRNCDLALLLMLLLGGSLHLYCKDYRFSPRRSGRFHRLRKSRSRVGPGFSPDTHTQKPLAFRPLCSFSLHLFCGNSMKSVPSGPEESACELQTSGLAVAAPAFMRGKERFSAPGNSLDSIMRFSAGGDRPPQRLLMTAKLMSGSACFEPISKSALYQGTTLVVPKRANRTRAFSPCGAISLSVRLWAAFGSSTCEGDIAFAGINKAALLYQPHQPPCRCSSTVVICRHSSSSEVSGWGWCARLYQYPAFSRSPSLRWR